MPRKPDPYLEKIIVDAAVRLLEKGGIGAITMREVAKAAGTTTPTLYERFADREALLQAITDVYRDELIAVLNPRDSLEQLARKFLIFCSRNPYSIDLLIGRIAANLETKTKGPIFEIVRTKLMKLNGFSPKMAEEITLATSCTMAGAALLMARLGPNSRAAGELEHATVKMMRRITVSDRRK